MRRRVQPGGAALPGERAANMQRERAMGERSGVCERLQHRGLCQRVYCRRQAVQRRRARDVCVRRVAVWSAVCVCLYGGGVHGPVRSEQQEVQWASAANVRRGGAVAERGSVHLLVHRGAVRRGVRSWKPGLRGFGSPYMQPTGAVGKRHCVPLFVQRWAMRGQLFDRGNGDAVVR